MITILKKLQGCILTKSLIKGTPGGGLVIATNLYIEHKKTFHLKKQQIFWIF